MLNIETARRIGINACIDKLGRDFVFGEQGVCHVRIRRK